MRTHRSLDKDAPIHRAIQHAGRIISAPVLRRTSSPILQNLIFGTDRDSAMASKADAFRKKAEEYRDLAQSATKPYAIESIGGG